jgi:hypothetical protein
MMQWIQQLFRIDKPIIAMCHLQSLPGDPGYDHEKGIRSIIEGAKYDLDALQDGGVDAVMFSNEFSMPYLTRVEPITQTVMARIIGELKPYIQVPLGVNVLWDPMATIDLAVAVDAMFIREVFTGAYASDFGVWDTDCGRVVRHQVALHGEAIKRLYNIVPEAAGYLGHRSIEEIARSTVFNGKPDALCVSGLIAGAETPTDLLKKVKAVVPNVPVFANTGVRLSNIEEQLTIADGAVVGTALKQDSVFSNPVSINQVRAFMEKARAVRG